MARIEDLGMIGDQRTGALLDRWGTILWYCPGRFDRPALLAGLLDPQGGEWRLDIDGATPAGRQYVGHGAVLETRFSSPGGALTVTDWMSAGPDAPKGTLCRMLSQAGDAVSRLDLRLRPGAIPTRIEGSYRVVVIDDGGHFLYASHELDVDRHRVSVTVPKGESGWAVLADAPLAVPTHQDVAHWRDTTMEYWNALAKRTEYRGPYRREVEASLRAIRLLTDQGTGGIVAAATTSLPEVPGGSRNWDYRYVWLRDAGMIASALTRLDGEIREGERYLDFICSSRDSSSRYPVAVFTTLDGAPAPDETVLDWAGFNGSRPVRVGNGARDQLQLDAFANVMLAAKLVYARSDQRPHWNTVETIGDFLVEHWQEPDHGLWEEGSRRQYTAGKVVAACALDSAADYSKDPAQAGRWRTAVRDIRAYVAEHCMTSEGAYAVYAGSHAVDVSAALFPVWAYTDADTPEMKATIAALERDWSWNGLLYWRYLDCADSLEEGAFLAGTFWVAQYWIMRGDLVRARRIIDAALDSGNDLGLFAEEYDPRRAGMLGNFPQAFVHAALIGAIVDLRAAEQSRSSDFL